MLPRLLACPSRSPTPPPSLPSSAFLSSPSLPSTRPEPLPLTTPPPAQAQTPQQRLANERYAKSEAAKRGKPPTAVKKQEVHKSPISKGWIGMRALSTHTLSRPSRRINRLVACEATRVSRRCRRRRNVIADLCFLPAVVLAFILCGGVVFELLRLFF